MNGNGDDASQNAHCHSNVNKCVLPQKTEINEVDLAVEPLPFSVEEVEKLKSNNRDPTYIKNCVGVDGTVLEKVLRGAAKLKSHPMYRQLSSSDLNLIEKHAKTDESGKDRISADPEEQQRLRGISIISNELPEDLFDEVEAIVLDVIKNKHWEEFLASPHYEKLINFLWFQDRKVVEEDFFVMRVLGRGGFGLVTGEFESSLAIPRGMNLSKWLTAASKFALDLGSLQEGYFRKTIRHESDEQKANKNQKGRTIDSKRTKVPS